MISRQVLPVQKVTGHAITTGAQPGQGIIAELFHYKGILPGKQDPVIMHVMQPEGEEWRIINGGS